MRRLGSIVVAAVVGRALWPLERMSAHPNAVAPILVALGAFVLLTAGFGAGPGRPVTRPIDATIFVLLGALLAWRV
jgi:hypothetical protein